MTEAPFAGPSRNVTAVAMSPKPFRWNIIVMAYVVTAANMLGLRGVYLPTSNIMTMVCLVMAATWWAESGLLPNTNVMVMAYIVMAAPYWA